jgi:hypothetical protein
MFITFLHLDDFLMNFMLVKNWDWMMMIFFAMYFLTSIIVITFYSLLISEFGTWLWPAASVPFS